VPQASRPTILKSTTTNQQHHMEIALALKLCGSVCWGGGGATAAVASKNGSEAWLLYGPRKGNK